MVFLLFPMGNEAFLFYVALPDSDDCNSFLT